MLQRVDFFYIDSKCTKNFKFVKKMLLIANFFYLKTQNLKVRSITNIFKKIKKKILTKNFLEPDAFSDKQYCKTLWACHSCAIWVRILFF